MFAIFVNFCCFGKNKKFIIYSVQLYSRHIEWEWCWNEPTADSQIPWKLERLTSFWMQSSNLPLLSRLPGSYRYAKKSKIDKSYIWKEILYTPLGIRNERKGSTYQTVYQRITRNILTGQRSFMTTEHCNEASDSYRTTANWNIWITTRMCEQLISYEAAVYKENNYWKNHS